MNATRSDIITKLQREILPLQGFKSQPVGAAIDFGLGAIENAFPNGVFPLGAVHEFISACSEDTAATKGFIACLLGTLMHDGRIALWIGSFTGVFPPALTTFGISPDRIIFVEPKNEKDSLWIMEEALKCTGLVAVVAELQDISFTASRRLQLAVEQSSVNGFIIRNQTRNLNTIAALSRWKITSRTSITEDGLPGLGFPRWNVELLKIRNGKPGAWQIEWSVGKFHPVLSPVASMPQEQNRRAG